MNIRYTGRKTWSHGTAWRLPFVVNVGINISFIIAFWGGGLGGGGGEGVDSPMQWCWAMTQSKSYHSMEPGRHQARPICRAPVCEPTSRHSGTFSEYTSGYGRCRNGWLLMQTRMTYVTEYSANAKCRLVVLSKNVSKQLNVWIDLTDKLLPGKWSLYLLEFKLVTWLSDSSSILRMTG